MWNVDLGNQESGLKWDQVAPTVCSGPVDWGMNQKSTHWNLMDCKGWIQALSILMLGRVSCLTVLYLGPICDGGNGRSWLMAAWWWLSGFYRVLCSVFGRQQALVYLFTNMAPKNLGNIQGKVELFSWYVFNQWNTGIFGANLVKCLWSLGLIFGTP